VAGSVLRVSTAPWSFHLATSLMNPSLIVIMTRTL
jgi:hypothetical protein